MTKFGPWKIWNGGENPCPGKLVQVQLDDDTRKDALATDAVRSAYVEWRHNIISGDVIAYREVIEPVRETVRLHAGGYEEGYTLWTKVDGLRDTHRITFDLIDGEPDCASIKMERLK